MKRALNVKYYVAASIAFLTFLVYLLALQNQFIGWDDGAYIIENVHIRSLNAALLKWAFFDFYASNWHPLTWISHAMDYAVWGLNPLGHHLTNNILHAVNTFLVVLLVARLLEADHASRPSGKSGTFPKDSRKRPDFPSDDSPFTIHHSPFTFHILRSTLIVAATTGLLFGLHPLHVESVAWVSERKDLLCALFYLLSVMMYTRYATDAKGKRHGAKGMGQWAPGSLLSALFFFTLALMSKPMAVSLPVVLLILDWYPFERIRSLKTFLSSVIGKLPFIALGIGSSILTIMAQEKAMFLNEFVPLPARILVAARAIFVYLGKMLSPMDLSPFYPYSGNVFLLSPRYYLPLLLLVGITAAVLYIGKRQKIWLSVWFYYVVTLLPVLGVVQVGRQSMADRYTYLPSIGPFLIAGLFVAWTYRKVSTSVRGIKLACITSALCLVIFLSYLTVKQIGIWNNTVDFWSYVIQKEPGVPFAYYGRGLAFYEMGRTDKALEDYDKAIELDPSYAKAYATRGFVFEKIGQVDKAIADYDKAIVLNPLDAQAYNNRGVIFEKMGQFDKAIADYNKVIEVDPDESQSYNNRGVVFEKMGRFDKAIADYDKAVALNPANADLYYNRGNAYDALGQLDKAIADYDKAIALNPRDAQAYNNRGLVFEKTGDLDKAIADYDKAVALNPSDAEAYNNRLAALGKKLGGLAKQGRTTKTMKDAAH